MSSMAKFEALLRKAAILGAEVRLVPMINEFYGDVEFYAHIEGYDSDTVDVCLDRGPKIGFLDLQRAASGARGPEIAALSEKAANFTRQPLK